MKQKTGEGGKRSEKEKHEAGHVCVAEVAPIPLQKMPSKLTSGFLMTSGDTMSPACPGVHVSNGETVSSNWPCCK